MRTHHETIDRHEQPTQPALHQVPPVSSEARLDADGPASPVGADAHQGREVPTLPETVGQVALEEVTLNETARKILWPRQATHLSTHCNGIRAQPQRCALAPGSVASAWPDHLCGPFTENDSSGLPT